MSTIYDIAKTTSVSPATVSRVINGRPGVNADTVRKIKLAMEKLDFRPRWKAVDHKRILLLIPEHPRALCGAYLSRVVAGVTDTSFAAGHTLVVRPFLPNVRSGREIRQVVMQEGASGCLMISLHQGYNLADKIGMEKIPHVIVGYKAHDDDLNQVLLKDYEAGREAAEYLLSLGHRKIAMVSFSHADHGHEQRYRGYADALKKARPTQTPACLQFDTASQDMGVAAARRLFSSPDRPTAVIVTNEQIALGLQREAKHMGFSIPEDFSVIGFEEDDSLENLDTPLTGMQTPAYEMGVAAVQMLLKEQDSSKGAPSKFQARRLPLSLIARRSTRALAATA